MSAVNTMQKVAFESLLCHRKRLGYRQSLQFPTAQPVQMTGPLTMSGEDLSPADFIYSFSRKDNREICRAVSQWKASGMTLGEITKETFPLETLGTKLRGWSRDLHYTTPVVILRGLRLEGYSNEELVALQTGISSYIGNRRGVQTGSEEEDKKVLLHVINLADKVKEGEFLPSSNDQGAMPFHTDSTGDVVGLFYREVSKSGGDLFVSPSWAVYNHLLVHYPEVVNVLMENWEWDLPGNTPSVIRAPLIHFTKSHLTGAPQVHFQLERRPFTGAPGCPRNPELAPVADQLLRALDIVDAVARNFSRMIRPQKADMLFLNNKAVFHARSAYRDNAPTIDIASPTPVDSDGEPIPEIRRWVARMILRDDEYSWPRPATMVTANQMFDRAENPLEQIFETDPKVWGITSQHG